MGGAAGQTLAGVISTSVHGSHFQLPPFPDWVRAIHLVGPDGREHWIEPRDRPITDPAKLQAALGPDVHLHYDDDWFDAALVTVGGLGIIYSVVLQVTDQYCISETREQITWAALRARLADGSVFAGGHDAVYAAVDPGSMAAAEPDLLPDDPDTSAGHDLRSPRLPAGFETGLAALCDGEDLLELLFSAAREAGRPEIIFPALAIVLPSIPAVVAVAAMFPPVLAALTVVGALATTAAAVPLLLPLLKAAGPGTVGDVLGKVLDQHPELTAPSRANSPRRCSRPDDRVDIAHQVMAPRNKAECVARGLALEIAFDTTNRAHLDFLDAALAMLRDEAFDGQLPRWLVLAPLRRPVAGDPVATADRDHLHGRGQSACERSAAPGRSSTGSKPLGRRFGGVQHWGMFEDCRYEDVARGYPRLDTWLRVREQLTSGGTSTTFDNGFMERCGLVPSAKPAVLLRLPSNGAVYVVYGGAKFHIPDPDTLGRLFGGVPIRDADAGELEHTGVVPGDGTLFHEAVDRQGLCHRRRRQVPRSGPGHTANLVFPGFVLRAVWSGALDHVPDRPVDGTFLRERNGTVSVILGGARFAMPDPAGELPAWSGAAPAMVNNLLGSRISVRGPVRQLWDGALVCHPTHPGRRFEVPRAVEHDGVHDQCRTEGRRAGTVRPAPGGSDTPRAIQRLRRVGRRAGTGPLTAVTHRPHRRPRPSHPQRSAVSQRGRQRGVRSSAEPTRLRVGVVADADRSKTSWLSRGSFTGVGARRSATGQIVLAGGRMVWFRVWVVTSPKSRCSGESRSRRRQRRSWSVLPGPAVSRR